MTEKIQLAINEIQDVIKEIGGISKAPYNPPGMVGDKWCLCYPATGEFAGSAGFFHGLHNLSLDLLSKSNSMDKALEYLTPYIDIIPKKLHLAIQESTWSNIETFSGISYAVGQMNWGGIDYYALRFVIQGVKVELIPA